MVELIFHDGTVQQFNYPAATAVRAGDWVTVRWPASKGVTAGSARIPTKAVREIDHKDAPPAPEVQPDGDWPNSEPLQLLDGVVVVLKGTTASAASTYKVDDLKGMLPQVTSIAVLEALAEDSRATLAKAATARLAEL